MKDLKRLAHDFFCAHFAKGDVWKIEDVQDIWEDSIEHWVNSPYSFLSDYTTYNGFGYTQDERNKAIPLVNEVIEKWCREHRRPIIPSFQRRIIKKLTGALFDLLGIKAERRERLIFQLLDNSKYLYNDMDVKLIRNGN